VEYRRPAQPSSATVEESQSWDETDLQDKRTRYRGYMARAVACGTGVADGGWRANLGPARPYLRSDSRLRFGDCGLWIGDWGLGGPRDGYQLAPLYNPRYRVRVRVRVRVQLLLLSATVRKQILTVAGEAMSTHA
jgi:hypothetical protein